MKKWFCVLITLVVAAGLTFTAPQDEPEEAPAEAPMEEAPAAAPEAMPELKGNGQVVYYNTLADYEKATGRTITEFNESPDFARQVAAGLVRPASYCTDIYDTHFHVPEGFTQTGCRLNPGCQSFTFTRGGERLSVWSLSMPDRVLAERAFEEWSKAFIERERPRRYVFERMAGSLQNGQCRLIGHRRARWFLWPNEWRRPSKAAVYGCRDVHRLYLALYEGSYPDANDGSFDLRMGHGDGGGHRAG